MTLIDVRQKSAYCVFLGVFSLVAGIAAGDEVRNPEVRLKALLQAPLKLANNASSVADQFQCEVYISGHGLGEHGRRVVLERDGEHEAALLLSQQGMALAHLVDNVFCLLDLENAGQYLILAGGHFHFTLGVTANGNIDIHLLTSTSQTAKSSIRLDVGGLIDAILARNPTVTFDEYNQVFELSSANGSKATVALTRNPRKDEYPISQVVLRTAGGFTVILDNFVINEVPPRTILNFAQDVGERQRMVGRVKQLKVNSGPVSYVDQIWSKANDADADLQAAGLLFLSRFKLPQELVTVKEKERLTEELARLNDAIIEDEVLDVVRALRPILAGTINPLRHSPDGPRPRFNAKYDRSRAAQLVEIGFGPQLSTSVYDAIERIGFDSQFSLQARAEALDVLGEIGVPPYSELNDALSGQISGGNTELLTVLSSVRIRMRMATDDDLKRVRDAFASNGIPPTIRLIAMESLALTEDVRPDDAEQVRRLLSLWNQTDIHTRMLLRRCLKAMAESSAGRDHLTDILYDGSARMPLKEIAEVLADYVTPRDPSWLALTKAAESIALDTEMATATRFSAARIAARGGRERPFSIQFVQSVLESRDPELITQAAVIIGMNQLETRPLGEIHRLLDSPDIEVRLAAVRVFAIICIIGSADELEAAGTWRVLDKMLGDEEPVIRTAAHEFLERLASKDVAIPPRYFRERPAGVTSP